MKTKLQKSIAGVSNAVAQVTEKRKKAVNDAKQNVQNNVQRLKDKMHDENYKAQVKKYNPLFHSELETGYIFPNMIIIAENGEHKDVEACQDALGWRTEQKGVEILHLYDRSTAVTELEFLPVKSNGALYYVDYHDKNKYIKMESYFDILLKSKAAELAQIAFSLGARKYSVDLQENSDEELKKGSKAFERVRLPLLRKGAAASAEIGHGSKMMTSKTISSSSEFESTAQPVRPYLRWFINDDNINNLINMRMEGRARKSEMKNYTIEINCADYSYISENTAANIDAAISRLNLKTNYEVAKQRKKESRSKLIFKIEF